MIVNNVKHYAMRKKYIVARKLDFVENGSDLFFWGAWDDLGEAVAAANELGSSAIVIETADVEAAQEADHDDHERN